MPGVVVGEMDGVEHVRRYVWGTDRMFKLEPKFSESKTVEKGWGREIVFANNNEYCGKILEIKQGGEFSMHYHIDKRETFYLLEGSVEVRYFDLETAKKLSYYVQDVGSVVDIPRCCPHQIHALVNSKIIEVSTHHKDSDSYRIAAGDSQKQV